MPTIDIVLREPTWPDLADKPNVHHVTEPIGITGLVGGMTSGAPSVALRIDLSNGDTVIAETSLKLLLTAADALKAKYGDPRAS